MMAAIRFGSFWSDVFVGRWSFCRLYMLLCLPAKKRWSSCNSEEACKKVWLSVGTSARVH